MFTYPTTATGDCEHRILADAYDTAKAKKSFAKLGESNYFGRQEAHTNVHTTGTQYHCSTQRTPPHARAGIALPPVRKGAIRTHRGAREAHGKQASGRDARGAEGGKHAGEGEGAVVHRHKQRCVHLVLDPVDLCKRCNPVGQACSMDDNSVSGFSFSRTAELIIHGGVNLVNV